VSNPFDNTEFATDVFVVRPWAFDQPQLGPTFDEQGREVFAVFSYDDGPGEAPYCNFSGTRFECNTQARAWNDALARGERVHVTPILRYL
jgi:hypothetical protein